MTVTSIDLSGLAKNSLLLNSNNLHLNFLLSLLFLSLFLHFLYLLNSYLLFTYLPLYPYPFSIVNLPHFPNTCFCLLLSRSISPLILTLNGKSFNLIFFINFPVLSLSLSLFLSHPLPLFQLYYTPLLSHFFIFSLKLHFSHSR